MALMDALEDAGIDYTREPEGYVIYLRDSQISVWESLCVRFKLVIAEENPPFIVGS
ncbi:MAG: hypothetical protein QF898_01140 [SAR202 cluster bacterium]|jgi:hypothetical protein|nr:hypothetical protein [SAR202 cluster bacterium]MDP6513123.1 hypothetical protein [SAR202 cluster bacterium]